MFITNNCDKGAGELNKASEIHQPCMWSDMKEHTLFIGDRFNCEGTKV
jgi:hypothetical protein